MEALVNFSSTVNLYSILNVVISFGLGILSFWLALSSRCSLPNTRWFQVLKFILGTIAICAVGNIYTLVLVGAEGAALTQLIFNMSLLMLLVWMMAFFVKYFHGCAEEMCSTIQRILN